MLIRHLLELIRFSHTLFALPFALLAAVMAVALRLRESPPVGLRWQEGLGILLCMVFARSAAMAFNRIADRKIDALNPRTARRHLPAGILSLTAVVGFAIACSLGFVASTCLFLPHNPVPVAASVPVLLFLFGYSLAKQFTMLAHFWLGASLMLAPLAAWAALLPVFSWAPIVLGLAVLFWVAGFDVIYACQDFEFDRQQRLHSVPARLGVVGALRLAAACHGAMVVLLAALPWLYPGLGWIYWAGVVAIALLLVYEHWIVKPDDLTRVNEAFFHVNAVVSIGLLVVTTLAIWVG